MSDKFKPDNRQSAVPYMIVPNARSVISFAEKVLDAKVLSVFELPTGQVMNAELKIDDSVVMVADAREDVPAHSTMLYFYVEDVDAAFKRATDAGAEVLCEPMDMFYGDRSCGIADPGGNRWWFATHKEDVSAEEARRRFDAAD